MKKIERLVALNSVMLIVDSWLLVDHFKMLPVWVQGLYIVLANIFLQAMLRAAAIALHSTPLSEPKNDFELFIKRATITAYLMISASLIQIDIVLTGTLIFEGKLGISTMLRGIKPWLAISFILFFVFHGQYVFKRKRGRLKA
jgi:hypothetical protein